MTDHLLDLLNRLWWWRHRPLQPRSFFDPDDDPRQDMESPRGGGRAKV